MSVEDGRRVWRRRHPAPIGKREFTADDVRSSGLAKGAALYARRKGNASARDALKTEAAPPPAPDNVGSNT